MQFVHSPQVVRVYQVTAGNLVRKGFVAAAAVLVLSSAAGCVAQGISAIPIAIGEAAVWVARAVPLDEAKYRVHPQRPESPEPVIAHGRMAGPHEKPQPAAAPQGPDPSTATAYAGASPP